MNVKQLFLPQSRHWLLFILAMVLYAGSINNRYSMDDELVTGTDAGNGNPKVMKGISGIPGIFTSHYVSNKKQAYEYRPLALATFAIEYQFFGPNPHISHAVNALIYALTCMILYKLLMLLFVGYSEMFVFLVALLFTVHPIHSEVVDSIKNRDELLAMLFSLLAFGRFVRFADTGVKKEAVLAAGLFALALLSKRSAIIFIGIIPVAMYYLRNWDWKRLVGLAASGVILLIAFTLIKKFALQDAVKNREFLLIENPLYLDRSWATRIPASIYISFFYLKKLIFPHPLAFYYGYKALPIVGWNNIQVWLSLLVHGGLIFFALKGFRKKTIHSFAIVIYMGALLPFANLLMPVVGIVGERFANIMSLGFCIGIIGLLYAVQRIDPKSAGRIKFKQPYLIGMVVLCLLFSVKVFTRHAAWEDHLTLYRSDIKYLDKSAKAHALLGASLYPKLFKMPDGPERAKLLEECREHFHKALEIYPDYVVTNNNLGTIYFTFMSDFATAATYFKKAVTLDPDYLEATYNLAYAYEKLGQVENSITFYNKCLELDSSYFNAYDRLTTAYYTIGNPDKAIILNQKGLDRFPANRQFFYVNIANAYTLKKDTISALDMFEAAHKINPTDEKLKAHIAKVSLQIGDTARAARYK